MNLSRLSEEKAAPVWLFSMLAKLKKKKKKKKTRGGDILLNTTEGLNELCSRVAGRILKAIAIQRGLQKKGSPGSLPSRAYSGCQASFAVHVSGADIISAPGKGRPHRVQSCRGQRGSVSWLPLSSSNISLVSSQLPACILSPLQTENPRKETPNLALLRAICLWLH